MNIIPVDSAGLMAIGYDNAELVLQVFFRDESSYQYLNVPAEVFQRFKEATSKGTFFNQFIRGAFDGRKLEAGG